MKKSLILKPTFIREDNRGNLIELLNGYDVKSIATGNMKAGSTMGGHYHKKTTVYFFILAGIAEISGENLKDKKKFKYEIGSNEGMLIPPHVFHIVRFLKKSQFLMAKSEKYLQKTPDTHTS